MAGGAPPPGAAPVAGTPQSGPIAAAPMADNVASALCYAVGLITGILFLVIAPYNQNRRVRFHAFQSIFLHVGVIALYIVCGFVFSMLHLFGLFFLWPLIGLGVFLLWLYAIVSAYQGKDVELPLIGPLARQQAG